MNKTDNAGVVKRAFFVLGGILFVTNVVLKIVFFHFAMDFLLENIFLSNIIATALYLAVFAVLADSARRVKEHCAARSLFFLWGFILLLGLFQNIYIIASLPTDAGGARAIIAGGIAIEVLEAAVGAFASYLLTGKKLFAKLAVIDTAVILFALSGLLVPPGNTFRLLTRLAMQYSGLLILNFLGIGFFYAERGGKEK
ncbi:MAG: hypothetical protein LBC78_00995 [Oscillospiraceae bacterium]|nr:hypothetical protein [Oscillospiraceae bacterium]